MDAKRLNYISVSEYLDLERSTNTRHEYHDGTIVTLAGGSVEHGLISGNTFGEIKIGLRNKNTECRVLNSEIKLFIESSNKYVNPDVMVICGDIEKTDREVDAVVNPIVIIEVLSKSTESYDRGDKFFFYRQIQTLQEYILIDQYQPQVDIYKRQSDLWEIKRIEGIEQQFEITSLGVVIDMKNIYEDIIFFE